MQHLLAQHLPRIGISAALADLAQRLTGQLPLAAASYGTEAGMFLQSGNPTEFAVGAVARAQARGGLRAR